MMSQVIDQPISELQLKQLVVEWEPHKRIKPNKYNPNRMSWHDRMLLRQSLLEDGWTQPIVTLPDLTIVDGEQRWTTAGLPISSKDIQDIIDKMIKRQEEGAVLSESIMERLIESKVRIERAESLGEKDITLATITNNLVPITRVDFKDDAHKMISTIRHNRARGSHNIDSMSEITQDLVALGLDIDDLEIRLGMDNEEIDRLLQQVELPDLLDLPDSPSQSWIPVHIQELEEDEAAQEAKEYQAQMNERKAIIEQQKQVEIAAAESEQGKALDIIQKEKIEKKIAATIPEPEKLKPPTLKRFMFFVTVSQYEKCSRILGDPLIDGFIDLCKERYEQLHGAWEETNLE